MRRLHLALLAAGLGAGAAIGTLLWLRSPTLGAAERGARLYTSLGCAACHGPGATGGVRNPGSEERVVPGFTGGTAMMYVESDEDIREWILDGRPARLAKSPAGSRALLRMPAYRDVLDATQVEDLVAWYRVVAEIEEPPKEPAAQRGREVAKAAGCFGCHGPGGRVGSENPGSFKGYVPGWASEDFEELVRNDEELRGWIVDGAIPRLADNLVASWFIDRQRLRMPAYRGHLTSEEINDVVAYVRWVAGDHLGRGQ